MPERQIMIYTGFFKQVFFKMEKILVMTNISFFLKSATFLGIVASVFVISPHSIFNSSYNSTSHQHIVPKTKGKQGKQQYYFQDTFKRTEKSKVICDMNITQLSIACKCLILGLWLLKYSTSWTVWLQPDFLWLVYQARSVSFSLWITSQAQPQNPATRCSDTPFLGTVFSCRCYH